MLNAWFLNGFLILILMATSPQAEMATEDFERVAHSFDEMIKGLKSQDLSSEQRLSISSRLFELGLSLEKTPHLIKNKLLPREPANIPDHVEKRAAHDGGGGFYFSPTKSKAAASKSNEANKRKEAPQDLKRAAKKLKYAESDTAGTYSIYVHTAFKSNYKETLLPVFDAKAALEKILAESMTTMRAQTKRNELALAFESHVRRHLKADPNLMRVVIYVGLCKDFAHRIKGHIDDVCNEEKCGQMTKGIFESTLMSLDINIGMHEVISGLSQEYAQFFEVEAANLFPVQMFGASAVIGNKNAHEEYTQYLAWPKRLPMLKRQDLDRVVEEQVERNIYWIFPRTWWPERLTADFSKRFLGGN